MKNTNASCSDLLFRSHVPIITYTTLSLHTFFTTTWHAYLTYTNNLNDVTNADIQILE